MWVGVGVFYLGHDTCDARAKGCAADAMTIVLSPRYDVCCDWVLELTIKSFWLSVDVPDANVRIFFLS